MSIAYGLTTGGHRYLGTKLEDSAAVLDCVLTEWYLSELPPFVVVISTEYGVVGGSIHGTTAYGLETSGRYLGSKLDTPIAVIDTVLTDWYFGGMYDLLIQNDSHTTMECGVVGGVVPNSPMIMGAAVSTECEIAAGDITAIDYAHVFGLKTGGNRYAGASLEDPDGDIDTVLTDWYFSKWDLQLPATPLSTTYEVTSGFGALISTEFGVVGSPPMMDTVIQAAEISTEYGVDGVVGIFDPILLIGTSSEVINLVGEI